VPHSIRQSTAASPEGVINPNVGYAYRRLFDVVPTGIFECNKKCACKKTCLNRVAQHALRAKLQGRISPISTNFSFFANSY
jgi:histone-lysine N-methyltransferase SETDB1